MVDYKTMESLINTAIEENISFISDEIYHGIEYENKAVSALQITNECYVITFQNIFHDWLENWLDGCS